MPYIDPQKQKQANAKANAKRQREFNKMAREWGQPNWKTMMAALKARTIKPPAQVAVRKFFTATNSVGNGWPVAWTLGTAADNSQWFVESAGIPASQIGAYGGPQEQAQLISALLNWYFTDPDGAARIIGGDVE